MKTIGIIALIIGIVILLAGCCAIAIGVKAGIDGTSWVEVWNSLWGIVPTPVDPTPVE